jgi:hypothetical protein
MTSSASQTPQYDFEIYKIALAPVPGFPSLYFEDKSCFLSIALSLGPLYAVKESAPTTVTYAAKVTTPKSQHFTREQAAEACKQLIAAVNTDLLAHEGLDTGDDYQLELIISVEPAEKVAGEEHVDVYLAAISIPVDAELYTLGSGIVWAQNEAVVSTRKRLLQSSEQDSRSIN